MRHRLQTGHDGVTALCYEQTRHLYATYNFITPEKDTHAQNRERVPLSPSPRVGGETPADRENLRIRCLCTVERFEKDDYGE